MVKRFLPIGILVAGFFAFFAFGLNDYVSLEVLKENRIALLDYVARNAILASAVFLLIYAVAIAFSVPGGAILTLVGGFMFGTIWGASLVVVGATLGATCVFLAAKTALERVGMPWKQLALASEIGAAASRCAPAHALAVLAREAAGV